MPASHHTAQQLPATAVAVAKLMTSTATTHQTDKRRHCCMNHLVAQMMVSSLNLEDMDVGGMVKKLLNDYNMKPLLTRPQHFFHTDGQTYFEVDIVRIAPCSPCPNNPRVTLARSRFRTASGLASVLASRRHSRSQFDRFDRCGPARHSLL